MAKATPSSSAKTGDALPIALIAAVAMLSFAVLLAMRARHDGDAWHARLTNMVEHGFNYGLRMR